VAAHLTARARLTPVVTERFGRSRASLHHNVVIPAELLL
jgi:hypothetical protein